MPSASISPEVASEASLFGYIFRVLSVAPGPITAELIGAFGLVEDRLRPTSNGAVTRTVAFKYHNFISTGFQPRAGTIQRLLRADVPITSQVVTVDPNHAFAPGT